MTVQEILSAWKQARLAGGAQFYSVFESLTGFSETQVRDHFQRWCGLTHETVEEIATSHGVTVREAGFQAYLADINMSGHPRISAIIDEGYGLEDGPVDPNPRQNKPWPVAEDCSGCDQNINGPHRFGCTTMGAQSIKLPLRII